MPEVEYLQLLTVTIEDGPSPSHQLLREAQLAQSSSYPLGGDTPEAPAYPSSPPAPSTRKSVRFDDLVAKESAGYLQEAAKAKTGAAAKMAPKGKLKRPSWKFFEPKSSPAEKAAVSRNDHLATEKDSNTAKEAGERRSGRPRHEIATYNDTKNTRAAAGFITLVKSNSASKAQSTTPPLNTARNGNSPGPRWKEEDEAKLRKACGSGKTWKEIQKVIRVRSTF